MARRMLGNFPQAFTHLALVDAAQDLLPHDPTRRVRAGRDRPMRVPPRAIGRRTASRSLRAMALVTNVVKGSGAERLLLMLHGYGADERDLGGLLPYLDPDGVFATVLPRAPLAVPGTPGYAWYEFGATDASGGAAQALAELDALVDEQCDALGFPRETAIFAGFSQGAGLALGLGAARERAALARPGVLAMSPAFALGDPAAFDTRRGRRARAHASTAPTTR